MAPARDMPHAKYSAIRMAAQVSASPPPEQQVSGVCQREDAFARGQCLVLRVQPGVDAESREQRRDAGHAGEQ